MIRAYALLVWFFVGFCGMFGAGVVLAEGTVSAVGGGASVPATYDFKQVAVNWRGYFSGSYAGIYSTAAAACQAGGTSWGLGPSHGYMRYGCTYNGADRHDLGSYTVYSCPGGSLDWSAPSPTGGPCTETSRSYYCSAGYTLSGTSCVPPSSCPANSAPVGGACVCAVGFDPSGGACVPRVCSPSGTPGGKMLGGTNATYCKDGCLYTADDRTCTQTQCYNVETTSMGQTCNKDTAEPVTPPDQATTEEGCAAQGKGWATINGVTVCADNKTSESKSESGTKTTTNPDASTATTTTTTNTTNNYENNTTTTTTTTTGPDGTTTETETQDTSKYCEAHPDAAMCKAASNPCTESNDKLSCAEFGEVADPGELTAQPRGVSALTPVSVASSFGCPADVQLPKGLVFSYSGACEFADGVRPVVLAMAWLIAGLIVFGFKSE